MSKNDEKYDPRYEEEADWSKILSKHFVRPNETPESQLAFLLDSGKKFRYEETLFYKVRSGQISPWIRNMPVSAKWWDMPWLRVADKKRKGRKKHEYMLKLLKSFQGLFSSIKKNGFVVNNFNSRIRCDKLTRNGNTCYIYVDGNKRMGILGYMVHSKQLSIKKVPIKIARVGNSYQCDWMPEDYAKKLFNFPFEVLGL